MTKSIISRKGEIFMAATVASILALAKEVVDVITNEELRTVILGTYSNGEIRSVSDAISGEFISPKEKKRILYGSRSKKKKSKKHPKFKL